jgi:hypothetical protein
MFSKEAPRKRVDRLRVVSTTVTLRLPAAMRSTIALQPVRVLIFVDEHVVERLPHRSGDVGDLEKALPGERRSS